MREMVEYVHSELAKLREKVSNLETSLARIQGQMATVHLLVKWVIFPLLLILAGLVGVKVLVPF